MTSSRSAHNIIVAATFSAIGLLATGCSLSRDAEGSPKEIETPGNARYERVILNAGIILSDGSIQAKLPSRIAIGQTIEVSFDRNGNNLTDTLVVTRISTKGQLCRVHTTPERVVGNTLYVRPCKVLR